MKSPNCFMPTIWLKGTPLPPNADSQCSLRSNATMTPSPGSRSALGPHPMRTTMRKGSVTLSAMQREFGRLVLRLVLRPRRSSRSSTPPPPSAPVLGLPLRATDCAKQPLDGLLHLVPNHVADHSDQSLPS